MSRMKMLFVTSKLPYYRIPLMEFLGKEYELTISHNDKIVENKYFKQIPLKEYNLFGGVKYIDLNYKSVKFDIIVLPFEIRIINLIMFLLQTKKDIKIGFFGLGVRASYSNHYDKPSLIQTLIKLIYLKLCSFAIFYDMYPKIKYSALGIKSSKLGVAMNTIVNRVNIEIKDKEPLNYIFIGSLYKEKGIEMLIHAFDDAVVMKPDFEGDLLLIGDGKEKNRLEKISSTLYCKEKIKFLGAISDPKELLTIFQRARVSISPSQAGLSVQTSFSYLTPFLTSENAITGGERFAIVPGVNGDFFDGTRSDLSRKILKYQDKDYCLKLGCNAYHFHKKYRNPEVWLSGFKEVIES